MTYWHMQLHPNDKSKNEEYEILDRGYIGLGDWDDTRATSQIMQFKDDMKKGDIVLIKKGSLPLALVEVIGDSEEGDGIGGNDWIYYKRDIKLLDKDTSDMPSFPQPRGTLQKSINKYTRTYQYIYNWYKKVLSPNIDMGNKIKSIKIKDYKMFHGFSINFIYENEPLSLVVIAGLNGTGKTTLLEYIKDTKEGVDAIVNTPIDFKDSIIYLDAMVENDNDIEKLILEYIDYFIYDKSENAVVGAENLQTDMDTLFEGFDIGFHFKKIDYKTKKPIFGRENSTRDDIEFDLKGLSTGERTLLSKMLYLHLKEAKNKIILIDEPETSLHPSWQNKILKFYEEFANINNCQIIIATHSPHIIGSAKPEYIRVLKKVDDKIEVEQYNQSYGLEFSQILTDIMGLEYLRTPDVAKRMDNVKALIIENRYDSDEFKEKWQWLEENLGKNYLDLKLLKLEIASRRKNASNS